MGVAQSSAMVSRPWLFSWLLAPLLLPSLALAQDYVAPQDCPGRLLQVEDGAGELQWVCAVKGPAPLRGQQLPRAADSAQSGVMPSELAAVAAPKLGEPSALQPPLQPSSDEEAPKADAVGQSSDQVPPLPPKKPTLWYGGPIVALDAGSTLAVIVGATQDAPALAIAGVGTYLLGGPAVHGANGQVGRAFGSLGLRLGVPLGGAGVGALIGAAAVGDDDPYDWGPAIGALFGFGTGVVGAMVLDSAVLARKPAPKPQTGLQWTPTVSVGKRTTQVSVVGTF
jgi:hypothetical protein